MTKKIPFKRDVKVAQVEHIDLNNVSISETIVATVAKTIDKKELFNGRPIEKSDLLMTSEGAQAIYATNWYVSSDGDIIKTAYIDGVKCVIIELCDASLSHLEQVCDMNIISSSDEISNVTRVRTQKISNKISLCKINYGYSRKLFINKTFNNTDVNSIIVYEAQNKKIPGKVIYEGVLTCAPENEVIARDLIKKILNTDKKAYVEWL